jgi:transposase
MGEITIGKNEYAKVHQWLVRNYGQSDDCEKCGGEKSKKYNWALIHGKEYEKVRNNFMKLCVACHRAYDMTDEKREHLRRIAKGNTNRRKLNDKQVKEILELQTQGIGCRKLAKKYSVDKGTIQNIFNRRYY